MSKKTIITVLVLLILLSLCFARCKTVEPGVIKKTAKYRIIEGNAKHFQMRYDAKIKQKLLTNKN